MKRREFGGMVVTAVAGLLVSGAALASGKKAQVAGMASTEAGVAAAAATHNPNSFYITITTFFPYAMPCDEYKSLVKNCRNVEESDKLLADIKAEGKLLSCESKLDTDRVTSCFEFCDEKAFKEYEARYEMIPGNSSKLKKQLGFHSKREFKQTVIS